jgi:hypothetical protein
MPKTNRRLRYLVGFYLILTAMTGLIPHRAEASDPLSQALTDLQVLYLFEDPEAIDWPTLFYLSEESACRIDLLTITASSGFYYQTSEIAGKAIHLHQYFVKPDDSLLLDSVLNVQFRVRQPDLLIIGADPGPLLSALAQRIQQMPPRPGSIFGLRKIYRYADPATASASGGPSVTVGWSEMYNRYQDRMRLEIPQLYPWLQINKLNDVRLMRYELVSRRTELTQPDPDFLSGLKSLRLLPLFDTLLVEGAVKRSFISRARMYMTFFEGARRTVGARRVDNIIAGYKALLALGDQIGSSDKLAAIADIEPYLVRLTHRAQVAVLKEIGMDWQGSIILRDSPHGPKLKFNASLTVNGPRTIELSYVRFEPYWDTMAIVLDSVSRKVAPHQSFAREYPVEIDRSRLEATMSESLTFVAEIYYGAVPLTVRSAIPIWERPELQVEFHPKFFFVPPVARLEVDKVVAGMNWKAVITKPRYYHGTVTLALETPRGVFAGAYRQNLPVEKGRVSETIRIPFSVSNLFELGVQRQTISLLVDGREVASDSGLIRIAACAIDDKVTIGLMPDSTGTLEDILRMTSANYRPLTDRSLKTGDLEAYTVILIGSGALRDYPSFPIIRGRVEEYIRHGGSLVIFGQPTDWPEGALPVGLAPSIERLTGDELLNRIPEARLLSQPYAISDGNLLAWMNARSRVGAAVVTPAERVYVTPTGATVLSVSRLGEGQVIFCGLPLVEMISHLNIEAIHLLANILNY